ncbi:MAG TPA: TauD/TfdA family dioxygenase [Acetobacteraceae bacterium]|jgi:taurine dioxygenase|nr:TauD/TfdA family dioxygenase [Acetobacteraceae bacterium]
MSATIAPASIRTRPLSDLIGADVEGVDLAGLDDASFAAIERAWADRLVLRFRHQQLTDVDLMNFSRRLGQLDRVPIRAAAQDPTDDPRLSIAPEAKEYVSVISNVKINGKSIGNLGNYESHWHTDMSYNEVPPMASALYAIEVPPTGGNTSFSNMYAAYETLDAATRQRVDGFTCIHDASRNSVGELRRGFADITDPRQTVGARHPLVRTHPVTKRKCLFLGRRRGAYIPELSLEESEALLDRLWTHAAKSEFCWTQVWQPGDLMLWDNRCALHRRDDFDDEYQRIMHRTQIVGDKPY